MSWFSQKIDKKNKFLFTLTKNQIKLMWYNLSLYVGIRIPTYTYILNLEIIRYYTQTVSNA